MGKKTQLRLRLSQLDAHYAGALVSGAKILELFGDIATLLLIENDSDEGLFRAYEKIDFLAPVYAGDYLEVEAKITQVGNTSRKIEFEARKIVEADRSPGSTAATVLKKPLVVAYAIGTCVVPKEKQRKR